MYDLDADPAYRDIPKRIMDGLLRWGREGVLPGGFLTAVLTGDLLNAVCLADDEVITHLRAVVKFVHNQMPGDCHSMKSPSKAVLSEWNARFKEDE